MIACLWLLCKPEKYPESTVKAVNFCATSSLVRFDLLQKHHENGLLCLGSCSSYDLTMVFDYVFNDHDTNLSYLHTVFVYGICLDTLWLPLTLQAGKKGPPTKITKWNCWCFVNPVRSTFSMCFPDQTAGLSHQQHTLRSPHGVRPRMHDLEARKQC